MGEVHAKWSPVAITWYRMLPEVVLLQDLEDDKAEELVKKCPVKVFDIEDIGKGRKRAPVERPRSGTLCRECIRGDGWDKHVSLQRVKDHFIFTIESTGALPPEEMFIEAVKIMEDKVHGLYPNFLDSVKMKRRRNRNPQFNPTSVIVMATRKEECPPQGSAAIEKEDMERELDAKVLLRLCNQHCGGVSVTHGIKDRVPTADCTTADFDDGSGEACTTEKCQCVGQQSHHFKCVN